MNRRSFLVCLLLVPTLTLAKDKAARSQDRLMERLKSYWDAARARDYTTMYDMEYGALIGSLSPAMFRRAVSRSKLESYEIKGVEIEGDLARVEMDRSYTLPGIQTPFPSGSTEYWLFHEGEWYRARKPRETPKP